ncbi:uncharacterized protein [Rutidosis leptorrhynchoides]|uniref:uncharacterized protein n=1 Tax=Rutidosis leptorrhynchoides TaxID=125765 RepID=UPI003A992682
MAWKNEDFFSWYLRLYKEIDFADWSTFNAILWFMWKNRNKAWKEQTCSLPSSTVFAAKDCITELFQISTRNDLSRTRQIQRWHWIRPPEGFYKLNCDAAVFPQLGKWGLGSVIRDHNATVIRCSTSFRDGIHDIGLAESSAILEGISLALSVGIERIIVESDALVIINELNKNGPCFLSCNDTLCSIKLISINFVSCSFMYTPRSNNRLIHSLTNLKTNGNGRLPTSLYTIAAMDLE